MNKRLLIASAILIAGVVAVILFLPREGSRANLDSFAQCLAAKNVTMYGADWCPHCQNEKKAFGDSFSFVPYVECPADPQKCLAQGIKGYPTWIFPDGRRLEGEQGLQKLSTDSGCPLESENKTK